MKTLLAFVLIILALLISDNLEASEKNYDDMTVAEILSDSFSESVQEVSDEVEQKVDEYFSYKLIFGGWSYHLRESETGYNYNQDHQFFGVEYQNWVAATFINSFRDRTYALGYDFNWQYSEKVSYGVIAGMTYGYDDKDMKDSKFNFVKNKFGPLLHAYVDYQLYKDESVEFRPNLGLQGTTLLLLFTAEF